ncbi:hypothetical protein D9756_008960 [Leucocoprinus leucothites]|uniref:Uncharacterized protein n=1 Tax=Leucocoprinus leucothites TaxID=201217 RepID=A0A8H5CYW1_9AGAR|nr:hypothetical protein D9756_008960 [Leucoagaricus leucothites]
MSTSASTSTKPKKDKSKKSKPNAIAESTPLDSGKNEGVDLNWAFKPPPGAKLIATNEDNGEFDWDAVKNNDDIELWAIRVPDNVKPKHLEGLSLDLSAKTLTTSTKGKRVTSRIGALKRKHTSYDIWSLGDEDTNNEAGSSSIVNVGGEELRSLTCLLPRKSKNGKLYTAPKPISRHLIISAHPPEPTPSETAPSTTTTTGSATKYKNPPRQKYPSELLTHRFMPYGSLIDPHHVFHTEDEGEGEGEGESKEPESQDAPMMEVDSNVQLPTPAPPTTDTSKKSKMKKEKAAAKGKGKDEQLKGDADANMEEDSSKPESVPKVEKEKKGKKRKGEDQEEAGGSTKKPKKAKMSSR